MAKLRRSSVPVSSKPSSPPNTANRNQLLAALPPDEYARILPTLELIPLKLKRILHKPGDTVQHVYFPNGGFLSVLTPLEDGSMVEVATVGREGMAGLTAVFDGAASPSVTMVQAESDICYRMPVDAFRAEMDRHGAFHQVLTRYAQAVVGVIMQTTACNAVHSIEQRLARWLLMAHDRVEKDDFPLTQEFVAMMLGAARPTVTIVAGTLQKAGLIKYHRGQITIVDRAALEAASCECYRVARELLRKANPPSAAGRR